MQGHITTTGGRLTRMYDWIGRHIRLVAVIGLLAVLALGVVGPMVANTDEPNFDPSGPLYEAADDAGRTLRGESTISGAAWLVEASDGGNALSRSVLIEWLQLSDAVRSDTAHRDIFVDRFDPSTGITTPGIISIADVVDAELANGLAASTDAEVADALDAALADGSPFAAFRFTLSERSERTSTGWFAPAFVTQVVYDSASFDDVTAEEAWLREVQADLRDGAVATDSIGVAIDGDSAFGEAAEQSAPFIFLAVALIIMLVAFVHRSYWSAVVVGVGLAATSLAYYGTAALIGLKMGSLLLAFIVPIAMISFGVDFYIHGLGRVREVQVEDGSSAGRAYPLGMTAVFTAMLLAVMSSVAAFMANAASGIESIIEFGIGSAISLVWAYLILGQISPRVTLGLEAFVGANPIKRLSGPVYALGAVVMAVVGGLAVALAAVMPTAGAIAVVFFLTVFVAVPVLITRRRNRRAASNGRTLVEGVRGAAHGLEPAGTVVEFLARWRIITIPVVIVVAVLGFARATQVESGLDIADFLSSDTDFAQSVDRYANHFPSSGEGSSMVFIEGDLTDPANLVAIDDAVAELQASDADFGRNGEGELLVGLHAAELVRMTMMSPAAAGIEASGPSLTDSDGDGIPDSRAAVASIYRHILANGVQTPDGAMAVAAEELPEVFVDRGADQATAITIQVGSFTDGEVIGQVESALVAAAASFESSTTDTTARVTGEVLTQYHSMDAFTRSMLVSLPLALALALLIAAVMLRSIRFALVSVLPIGLVVLGIYAFMATFDYSVNVVTATIAAIAVGVGIDFSTHFTARYREELGNLGDRLEAVRVAGAGTGGALVLSALTSVLGFLVMAMAPTPIFATFGLLTAVMIVLSLLVAVIVLPSLLVLVSSDRRVENEAVEVEEVVPVLV